MKDIRSISTALLLLISVTVVAQGQLEEAPLTKPYQWKSRAKYALQAGDLYTAIDYYERYCTAIPTKLKDAFTLADLYRRSRDYQSAAEWYNKCYEADPAKFADALYYKGLMLKQQADYAGALIAFEKYKSNHKSTMDKARKKQLKNDVLGAQLAPALLDSSTGIEVNNLDRSINNPHIELSPVLMNDSTLLYASLKANSIEYYHVDTPEAFPARQFYTAKKKDGEWKSEGRWKSKVNLEEVNTGNGVFSPDGNRFYFTRCETNNANKTICELYMATKKGGKWRNAERLGNGINSKTHTTTMPAIGTDTVKGNEILYFVSDRPGGKGGMDIWFSIYDTKKNAFKAPKNAGSKINTSATEMTPYYDQTTSALFFSSGGWPGIGGLDVFKAKGQMRRFEPAVHLGCPANSCADDLYFVAAKEEKTGFMVSNRLGGAGLKNPTCCDDIYSFGPAPIVIPVELYVKGRLLILEDAGNAELFNPELMSNLNSTLEPLSSATVSLYSVNDLGEAHFVKSTTTDSNGDYYFNVEPEGKYRVAIDKEGYLSKTDDLSTPAVEVSDTVELAPLPMLEITKEPIRLPNILYASNSAELSPEAASTIDTTLYRMLVENPDIIIEIGSHSDSRGSSSYNRSLSEKRAKSVQVYLAEKGIAVVRLEAKGYGEDELLEDDVDAEGKYNEAAGTVNRRTAFRIVGSVRGLVPDGE